MANVQLFRIEFITSNPFTTFVAGDVLDIYLETTSAVVPASPFSFVTTGITVNLNTVSYPSAGSADFLLLTEGVDYLISSYNPQVCIGTSLLGFFTMSFSWPYAYYYSQENHYSCTVNPPTCNLVVNGVPEVVPATDTATADGSIQINASSTNPIEYKIGGDFVYGDGTAQSENSFSGLLPGSYRIYLRDSANCAVNVLAEVTVNNLYGTKFRLEYVDNNLQDTRIDIVRRGYSGALAEIWGSGTPFEIQLRGEGSQDKFEALMSSQGNLNLTSLTDLAFLELYTNDPNLYRIHYNKKFSDSAVVSVSLPALATWLTESTTGPKPDWNVGTSTPNITIAGLGFPNNVTTENLYVDFAFIPGNAYSLSLTFTRVVNSGINNPRTAVLKVTDSSTVTIFSISTAAIEGSNTITLDFVANASCTRIAFTFGSGSNVTITVTSTAGTTNGHELLWVGKILPQQYLEEYKAPPYYVSVVATDGLAELKTYYLIQGDGQKYFGTISLIKLVAYCLSVLKLNLNIRVACNLYAIDMDQDAEDDPFDQAYVDFELFYLAEKEPTLDFVLKSILDSFGARITQWENRWNIVRVEEMSADYDYRDFDSAGNYVANGTYAPVIDIQFPDDADETQDVVLANADHSLEMKPGYGRLKAIYSLGLKPNILNNGDFRLKSIYDPVNNIYYFDLNKDGWTLVNAGYVISEGYEFIDENNIAYTISSGEDTLTGTNGGEAYVQSELYSVKMGTNNQLKITVRCKVSRVNITVGTTVYSVDVPYVKIRFRVKYGSLYLRADGTWSSTVNILTFYCTEFNKFADYEILASQPTTGTPVSGMDLDVRVFHGYAYHADFFAVADLEGFETWDGSAQTVPTGYRTEMRISGGPFFGTMYYYELEENTDAASGFDIVEPDDYNGSNERKWILKAKRVGSGGVSGTNVFPFAIDKVQVQYLTDGREPIDTIVRTTQGEVGNTYTLEKELVIGSYSNLIVSEISLGIDLGVFFPSGGLAITTTNTLSADLIYTGYLRDSNGVGYDNFARDGVAESDKLHGILLKSYAMQYKRSWRLLRGGIYAHRFFGLLNVGRLVNDSNRIYLPIGLTLNDKMCLWSGEFLELRGTADEGGTSPFTSAFTVGFGSGGFN